MFCVIIDVIAFDHIGGIPLQLQHSQGANLGQDKISRLLFQLALPAILAQLINLLYNMVDRMYIGNIPDIGATALTGVGVTFPVLMIVSAFAAFAGMGGAPRAGIRLGAGDKEGAEQILGNCVSLLLALSLAACGGADDDDDTDLTDFIPMTVEELTGGWVDDDGNQLVIDPDTGTYDYRTWYGRVGFGPFEVVDDRPMIEYDGFYYDFEADSGGFILRQNGASDRAGLDGAHFGPGESDVYAPELSTLDGIWQDALGETLVIDTGRMEYLAYSPDGMTGGTIRDGGDGLGVYLFLNGRGYFAVSPDGNSFTLFFEASDTNAPDGTYEGVFYRNGDADLYAELDDAEFYASDGHLRYYDGENIFFLPDTYSVAADGLAYDSAGNVFAAGWDMPYYDPADDWGDNWASNWN